jgi:hypothetical protein
MTAWYSYFNPFQFQFRDEFSGSAINWLSSKIHVAMRDAAKSLAVEAAVLLSLFSV